MDVVDNATAESAAKAATIVGGPPRTKMVTLIWPVAFNGKTYREIAIRRVTAGEVDAFVQAVRAGDADVRLPMFDAPPEVLDAMDSDDSTALNEAAAPFLPRALRVDSASTSDTSATSPASSPGT